MLDCAVGVLHELLGLAQHEDQLLTGTDWTAGAVMEVVREVRVVWVFGTVHTVHVWGTAGRMVAWLLLVLLLLGLGRLLSLFNTGVQFAPTTRVMMIWCHPVSHSVRGCVQLPLLGR
jgi:hypothetical protein